MGTGASRYKRWRLAGIIFCLYYGLLLSAGGMFIGADFIPRFFWITGFYGLFVGMVMLWVSKTTQKYIFGHVHRLVSAPEESNLSPGDLKRAKSAVLTIPWVAAGRDTIAWFINAFVYVCVVLNLYCKYTKSNYLPNDALLKDFLLVAFPLFPLVMVTGLLAYSAATHRYIQYFFREGEYEKFKLALTPPRRRILYVALVSYTLIAIIGALDYNVSHATFRNMHEMFQSLQDTELVGGCLLVGVCSLLTLLSRMEFKAQRAFPLQLQSSNKTVAPDKHCPKCQMTVGALITTCPRDGTPLSFPGDETASFGTSYEFLEEIARGGMSVIYKARHRLMKKLVAIKMMDTKYAGDRVAVERFNIESQAISRLAHPHIVAVFDFGQFESHKLFLVMEYLSGQTLAKLIEQAKPSEGLPVRDVLLIFDQICDAMSYAHEQRVLHRDLKPSNIMVEQQEMSYRKYTIKIVDFGIAKVLGDTAAGVTKTGDVFGTPDYMSPEQCLGMQLDARSDIYSMGCLMYEVLTGIKPFAGDNALATMYRQINEQPALVDEVRAELKAWPGLAQAVNKALAKQAGDRYANFSQLRSALQSISAAVASAGSQR